MGPLKDKAAIIVDDGIATGATVRASVRALKKQGPKRTVVATPVAPSQAIEALQQEADEVIRLETPEYFGAIGFFLPGLLPSERCGSLRSSRRHAG